MKELEQTKSHTHLEQLVLVERAWGRILRSAQRGDEGEGVRRLEHRLRVSGAHSHTPSWGTSMGLPLCVCCDVSLCTANTCSSAHVSMPTRRRARRAACTCGLRRTVVQQSMMVVTKAYLRNTLCDTAPLKSSCGIHSTISVVTPMWRPLPTHRCTNSVAMRCTHWSLGLGRAMLGQFIKISMDCTCGASRDLL